MREILIKIFATGVLALIPFYTFPIWLLTIVWTFTYIWTVTGIVDYLFNRYDKG